MFLFRNNNSFIFECAGLAGYYPIHPRSYMKAWRSRAKQNEALLESQDEAEEATAQ